MVKAGGPKSAVQKGAAVQLGSLEINGVKPQILCLLAGYNEIPQVIDLL